MSAQILETAGVSREFLNCWACKHGTVYSGECLCLDCFKVKVEKAFKKCLDRQVRKGINMFANAYNLDIQDLHLER